MVAIADFLLVCHWGLLEGLVMVGFAVWGGHLWEHRWVVELPGEGVLPKVGVCGVVESEW